MNRPTAISGAHIQHLVTKYFYQKSKLCFQILLRYSWNETVVFGEYESMAAYKKAFRHLQAIRSKNLPLVDATKKVAVSA